MVRFALALFLLVPACANADLLKDLARNAEILDVQLSPTGEYLGVLREVDDKRTAVFFSFPAMKPLSVMEFPGRNEVGDFWWVGDERIVASVVFERDRFEEELGWGELYGMNVDGSSGEHLYGLRASQDAKGGLTRGKTSEYGSAQIIDQLWDDEKNVLVSITKWNLTGGYRRVVEYAKLNVYNGRITARQIAPVPDAQLVTDAKGEVRFAFSISDAQDLVIHYRNPESGRWEEFSKTPYGESGITPVATHDDGRVYVSSGQDGKAGGIYLLDPKSQQKTQVYQHARVDSSPRLDFRNRPYGVRVDAGLPAFVPIDESHPNSRLISALKATFPDRYVGVTSTTHEFKLSIVAVIDDNHTPEYYLHNADTNQLQLMFDAYPWIDDKALPTTQPISFTTRDGILLDGYLSLPPGSLGKNMPLVIVPHGGPHGPRDYWGFSWETFIPASGFAMLQVNYRGSGGYGTAFEKSGFRKWATDMQNDLTDGVNWAIKKGIADADRVCIFGWSYGGYAAVMSLAREPELYRCSIAGAGVYDQEEQYQNADFADQTRWGRRYMDKVIGPSPEDRVAASPVTYIDKIKTPLLLIHGEEDMRVPIEHSRTLIDSMKKAGKTPPRLIELPNEGHSPANAANVEIWYRSTIDFLNQHIGKET